jgi:hypothetical protein
MANIRREFGDDLTLKNGNLGINTTTAQERVDVVGVVKGRDLNVTGVSSLTAYEGFLRADNQIVEETNLEFGNGLKASLSGEIIVGTGVTVTISAVGLGTTSVGVGTHTIQSNIDTTDINLAGGSEIECLKVYNTFTPPSGGTNERPYKPKPGELYYNYDLKTIEFHDGYGWRQVDNTTKSGRGVWMGGEQHNGTVETEFNDYVSIPTLGNSLSFGDLSTGNRSRLETAGASSIRGVFGNGRTPTNTDIIDYITIASNGKAIDFGNSQQASGGSQNAGVKSSSTRGVFSGGTPTNLQYIQIGTLGNSLAFGDLTDSNGNNGVSASTPTRGVYAVGTTTASIEAITFASTGSSVVFGECQEGKNNAAGAGNSVRGVFAGGYRSPGDRKSSNIEFVNLASLGNAQDFGDLTIFRACLRACSTQVRAVFGGGYFVPSTTASGGTNDNRIDYVTIATAGNAQDFGDLSSGNIHGRGAALSDSHGGLGGF